MRKLKFQFNQGFTERYCAPLRRITQFLSVGKGGLRVNPLSLAILLVLLAVSNQAAAGVVTVFVPPGERAFIAWGIINGPRLGGVDEEQDLDGDGAVNFTIPEEHENRFDILVSICKLILQGPRTGPADVSVRAGEGLVMPLSALEPSLIPTFARLDQAVPVVAQIALKQLIDDGGAQNLFSVGDVLSVVNGAIGRTSSIVFRDGTSMSADPFLRTAQLLDLSLLNSLPRYTGDVFVGTLDRLDPLTEPATLMLAIISLCGLALSYRSSRSAQPPRLP